MLPDWGYMSYPSLYLLAFFFTLPLKMLYWTILPPEIKYSNCTGVHNFIHIFPGKNMMIKALL